MQENNKFHRNSQFSTTTRKIVLHLFVIITKKKSENYLLLR